MLPASNLRIDELRAGAQIVTKAVTGIQFWTTQEIDEGALLVSATVDQALGAS
jgi:hypothetical protein